MYKTRRQEASTGETFRSAQEEREEEEVLLLDAGELPVKMVRNPQLSHNLESVLVLC